MLVTQTRDTLPKKHACVEAQMEMYFDSATQDFLITMFFVHIRDINASTQPWKPGENAFDKNPQWGNTDHPIHQCLPAYWSVNFIPAVAQKKTKSCRFALLVWCRGHDRIEQIDWAASKCFALAVGLYSFDEWINIVPGNDKAVGIQQPRHELQGSHRCGNGAPGCIGVSCVTMEGRRFNNVRDADHFHGKYFSTDECICDAGRICG